MADDPNLIWTSTIDDRYIVRVERTGDYTGELVILDGDKEVLRDPMELTYQALFDPDNRLKLIRHNRAAWQDRAVRFVDENV